MKFQRLIIYSAIILSFAFSALAQTPTPTPVQDDDIIKVESRLVVVPVSVLDANGLPVLGLTAKDFRVLEENRLQEIAQVSDAEKVPLEIVILFDIRRQAILQLHYWPPFGVSGGFSSDSISSLSNSGPSISPISMCS